MSRVTLVRRRRAAVGLVALGVVASVVVLVAQGGSRPGAARGVPAQPAGHAGSVPRIGVGLATCTFVERTVAPTYDYLTRTESTTRTLVTQVRYPTLGGPASGARPGAPPDRAGGPYPAVFFASGYRLDPGRYASLLDAWVRSGLVVVAPVFPYTNPAAFDRAEALVPGADPEDDLPNEPADLAFVARRTLAASAGQPSPCPVLSGLVAPGELGLAGQSDGGQVAGMLGYDERDRAPGLTFRAVEVLSGMANGSDPYGGGPGYPALLVVQSSQDACNTPQEAAGLYDEIDQRDKWFLEDHGTTHLGPYVGSEPATFGVVSAVTTRFFDLVLRGERPGARFVALADRSPRLARLTTGPTAPVMAPRGSGGVGCYER